MKKTAIILISLLFAFIIMTSGYGLWEKELKIIGSIQVVEQPQEEMDVVLLCDDLGDGSSSENNTEQGNNLNNKTVQQEKAKTNTVENTIEEKNMDNLDDKEDEYIKDIPEKEYEENSLSNEEEHTREEIVKIEEERENSSNEQIDQNPLSNQKDNGTSLPTMDVEGDNMPETTNNSLEKAEDDNDKDISTEADSEETEEVENPSKGETLEDSDE